MCRSLLIAELSQSIQSGIQFVCWPAGIHRFRSTVRSRKRGCCVLGVGEVMGGHHIHKARESRFFSFIKKLRINVLPDCGSQDFLLYQSTFFQLLEKARKGYPKMAKRNLAQRLSRSMKLAIPQAIPAYKIEQYSFVVPVWCAPHTSSKYEHK